MKRRIVERSESIDLTEEVSAPEAPLEVDFDLGPDPSQSSTDSQPEVNAEPANAESAFEATPEEKDPKGTLRNFCITIWMVTRFVMETIANHKYFRYMVYQHEVCPETNRPHIHLYAEFTHGLSFKQMHELLPQPRHKNEAGFQRSWVQKRRGTRTQAREYCMVDVYKGKKKGQVPGSTKEFGLWIPDNHNRADLAEARALISQKKSVDDCYGDPLLDKVTTRFPKWVERVHSLKKHPSVIDIQLNEWEQAIWKILDGPPKHRRVLWVWSRTPEVGKTTFMEWVSERKRTLPLTLGKSVDFLAAYDNHDIVWFDFPRARDDAFIPYEGLEIFSNIGYKTSTKFQPVRKYINCHCIVTANIPPNETKLANRLEIYCLDKQEIVSNNMLRGYVAPATVKRSMRDLPPSSRVMSHEHDVLEYNQPDDVL